MGTIGVALITLVTTRIAPDVVFIGVVALLLVLGVLDPAGALAGFSNEGFATIAVLYVIAAGLRETGVVHWISRDLLGNPASRILAQLRLMTPVALLSAFMNNTPIVALMVPAVAEWARRLGMPVGQLMIPLSYAAIVGGTCSLIGTNTNLIVYGMLLEHGDHSLHMFELAWVGVPCVLVTVAFVTLTSRWLLPSTLPESTFDNARDYVVEMVVCEGSELIGRTIEGAGLRHLPGMFLIGIERDGLSLPAVSPRERLREGDRLTFAGLAESVADLTRFSGLIAAPDQVFKLRGDETARTLAEAVVSDQSPAVGRTIRDARFRSQYNAVVIAVARAGHRIHQRIGDIVLQPGDLLLLQADDTFAERYRFSRDFLLVRSLRGSSALRHGHRLTAIGIVAAMVAAVSANFVSLLEAALLAAGAMLATGCVSVATARRSVDWQVLLVVATSLALGDALERTGGAAWLAAHMSALASSATGALAVLFAGTALATAVISNVAAAALMFPVAIVMAEGLGAPLLPFAIVIMVAASASFATPTGYQTNLMVYGPGMYTYRDYLRIGLPLTLLVGVVTVIVTARVWL